VSCAVELHSHLPLFTSDVSTIGAADTRVVTMLVGDLRPPQSWEVRAVKWRGHVVPNCCKCSYTCFQVLCSVSGTADQSILADRKEGSRECTVLCMSLCALYEGGTVTSPCLCCRLLLCSCRRHLASGAPVHHQELLWILFQCLWICYQGKKQI
jgi:hypothetical protein